ncbi:hypothetical protein ASZ78_012230 [Callipepla squamata]|uniref:Uncharacterized protein n=1 Tax=Callipepla squamata TaxID=9009 RepID=A0A226ME69_CALSU|nr:hypothetical protein ASZ78_012230 [Callipepla squamata]
MRCATGDLPDPQLAGGGQREIMLERVLYQKYWRELLAEIHPPPGPTDTLSTTHWRYQAGGFQPTPAPATQGITCICTGNTPFCRNAPITEYLEQPLLYEAASPRPQPSMQ